MAWDCDLEPSARFGDMTTQILQMAARTCGWPSFQIQGRVESIENAILDMLERIAIVIGNDHHP